MRFTPYVLILSTRAALVDFLRDLVRRAPPGTPLLRPIACRDLALLDGHRPLDGDRAFDFVVVDLGSRTLWPGLPAAIRTWAEDYPATCFVYLLPMLDPCGEPELLGELTSLAPGVILGPPACEDPPAWWPILTGRLRRLVYRGLELALLEACAPAEIVSWSSVSKVLAAAPSAPSVEAYCNSHRIERRSQWRLLHGTGQRPTSDLLRAFRLLWVVRLREKRWSPGDVAAALEYADASDCARRVGGAFELGMREIAQLSTRRVCAVFARDLLRTARDGHFTLADRMLTLRAIGQRLSHSGEHAVAALAAS